MTHPYRDNEHKILSIDAVDKIVRKVAKSKTTIGICRKTPRFGDGGEVFVYELQNAQDVDWKSDGCNWFIKGSKDLKTSNKKRMYTRNYYHLRIAPKQSSDGYTKTVTFPTEYNPETPYAVIQYLGDKSMVKPIPHGNSKRDRPFVRTTPSTREKLFQKVKKDEPKKSYEDTLQDVASTFEKPSELESSSSFALPRDLKQAQNAKYEVTKAQHVTGDEIFSIYELGAQDFAETILSLELLQDFSLTFGHPSGIVLANRLISRSKSDSTLPQLLAYDTTFDLGRFYVTPLAMRNTELVNDPIFPVIFMIHERKFERTHARNWFDNIIRVLHIKNSLDNIPIITDREKAITNAIKCVIPESNLLFCTNHIKRDVTMFLNHHKATSADYAGYMYHLEELLESSSEEEFDELVNQFKPKWSQPFSNYFEKYLGPDLRKHCCRFNTDNFAAFNGYEEQKKNVTNNAIESLNASIKRNNSWKQLPVDSLFLALYKFQRFLLFEFNRAYNGEGRYDLKPQFRNLRLTLRLDGVDPVNLEDILVNIKRNRVIIPVKSTPTYRMTQIEIANMCIKDKLVDWSNERNVFIIESPFRHHFYSVWKDRYSEKWICSCMSTGKCYHKLVIEELMAPQNKESDIHKYYLTLLAKKRLGERKGGKKQPRKRDVEIIAAPDSMEMSEKELTKNRVESVVPPKNVQTTLKPEVSILQLLQQYKPKYIPGMAAPNYHPNASSVEILNTPEKFQIKFFQGIRSLGPKQFIDNFVINDAINLFIQQHNMQDKVGFIDNFHFNVVWKQTDINEHLLQFHGRSRFLNKEILLVNVNFDPDDGVHWVLGVIIFKVKKIIILDSIESSQNIYNIIFENLRKTLLLVYGFADVVIDFDDWEYLVSSDCKRQPNLYDCGLFTMCHAYAVIRQECYFSLNSEAGRHWIRYLMSTFKNNPPRQDLHAMVSPSDIRSVQKLYRKHLESCTTDYDIQFTETEDITSRWFDDDERDEFQFCASVGCPGDFDATLSFGPCVACRELFHHQCIHIPRKAVYLQCPKCANI